MNRPRFRQLPHVADVRVAVWGADRTTLLRNVVAAVLHIAGVPRPTPARTWVRIADWPQDLETAAAVIANEALFQLTTRRQLAVDVRLDSAGAELGVAPLPDGNRPDREIKAVTYHDLRCTRAGGRYRVILTLDL